MSILDSTLHTPGRGQRWRSHADREQQGGTARSGPANAALFRFPGQASIVVAGVAYDLSGQSVPMDLQHHVYQTYIIPPDPTLLVCAQEDWPAISAAHDVAECLYHISRHDLRLPTPVSTAIAGGLVSHLSYAAHFDSTYLLTSVHVSAGSARTTAGTVIPFAAAYLPVPGGVAGTYLVCLAASGVLSLASAAPAGTFPIAQIQIMNRPTDTFDAPLRTSSGAILYPTTPVKLFENGATITPAAGLSSLPSTAYRTDDHTPDGDHDYGRYYTSPPPSDGTGGYVLPSSYNIALAAGQIPPLANSPSWADPLCALSLSAYSGTVGGSSGPSVAPGSPHGPAITVGGPAGDYPFDATSDLASWQSGLFVVGVSYGGSVVVSEAPLRYIGVANIAGPGWVGAPAIWVAHSGARLLAEYMAP